MAGLLGNTGSDAPDELWDRIAERLHASDTPGWEKVAAHLVRPAGARDVIADEDTKRTAAMSGATATVVAPSTRVGDVIVS